jgi:hypothetical protein
MHTSILLETPWKDDDISDKYDAEITRSRFHAQFKQLSGLGHGQA